MTDSSSHSPKPKPTVEQQRQRIKELAAMNEDELTETLKEEWDAATPEQRQIIMTNLRSLFGVLQ